MNILGYGGSIRHPSVVSLVVMATILKQAIVTIHHACIAATFQEIFVHRARTQLTLL